MESGGGGYRVKKYSQGDLDELIACPKRIIEPPRKEMKSERGSLRNDMQLESLDGKFGFAVFMRINERFPENFSVGLNVVPKNEPGSFCVLRYNGPHGEHVNSGGGWGADGLKRAKKQNGRLLEGRTWDAVPEGHLYCSPMVEAI